VGKNTALQEARDQLAHIAVSVVSVAPVITVPSVYSAAFAGFMLGLNREVGEQQAPLTFAKLVKVFATQKRDLSAWTFGAAAYWLVLVYVL
jgi:ABC-type molybdate transport system permease subunit